MASAATANQPNLSPDFEHEGELEYDEDKAAVVTVCSNRENARNSDQVVDSEYDEDFEGEGDDQHGSYDDDLFELDKDLSMDQSTAASLVS
jgi:hypothetical protein